MKNKLADLNNYLFEQIEKLNEDDLSEEQLTATLKKAEAINRIADTIIKNGELQFKAVKMAAELGVVNQEQVKFLLAPSKDKGNENK
jgi:hypothetical protein